MCIRVSQVYMFLSQSNIFISSPRWIFISSPVGFVVSPLDFLISPVENSLLGLTPGKVLKTWHFPRWVKQSLPGYWEMVCWNKYSRYLSDVANKWTSRSYAQMIQWGWTCTYEMVERRWGSKVLLLTKEPAFWMMI